MSMLNKKVVSVVVALHLIGLSFFFFTPPINYFAVICLSTVIVWSLVFCCGKRMRLGAIIVGALLQLAIQQLAYHAWLSDQVGVWWPLAQFLGLQYVMALRLGGSEDG